jgi:hypothetical protein
VWRELRILILPYRVGWSAGDRHTARGALKRTCNCTKLEAFHGAGLLLLLLLLNIELGVRVDDFTSNADARM